MGLTMTREFLNPARRILDVERLANVFGGQCFVQSGHGQVDGRGPRRFWRLIELADRDRRPAILNAQQISNSWAMRGLMDSQPRRWRTLDDGVPLVYVLKGQGEVRLEDQRFKVAAGDLFVAPRGRPHAYGPDPGTRWDEFSCRLSGRIFESWFRPGLLDPHKPLRRLLPIEDWLGRFHEVILPLAEPGAEQGPDDWAKLIGLLGGACAHQGKSGPRADDADWLARATAAIRAEPLRPQLDLDRVAAKLGVGQRTFRRRFTRLAGLTPHRHHSQRVMDEARAMLGAGEPLATIAARLGFPNAYYLSRRFKQVTGQTPTEYRTELQHR